LAVHIRLRRVGKTKAPTYRVVIADSRAPRNGKFIESIGHYDPLRDIQMTKGPVDDLDDAADLPAYGGKMGIDATKKWASEGYTRNWPARVSTTEAAGRRAAEIIAKLRRP